MKISSVRAALALGLVVSPIIGTGHAHAQAWIGQIVGNMIAQEEAARRQAACMSGTPMPDAEIAETRATAYAAIAGYWQAVRGGKPADTTSYFTPDSKIGWTSGATKVGPAGLTAIVDPLAIPGAAIEAEPIGYLRAGDGRTVWGQWRVRRADGSVAGTYDALFRRTGATWKLSQLTVVPSTVYADPVVQYCATPNDVLPYRLASSERARTYLVKRADKLKLKADKARADADRASARGDAAAMAEARARADDAAKKSAGAADMARAAIEENDKAKAEAAAADARKAEAIAKLSG